MSANTILVFSEKPALMAALLNKARQQADSLGWVVAAIALDVNGAPLGDLGADVVYQCRADERNPEVVVAAITAAAELAQPGLCLIGATHLGMESAPRVAERLGCGYAAWASEFEIDPAAQSISAQCMLYTGTGVATYHFKPGLVILTAAQGVFEPGPVAKKTADIKNFELPVVTPKMTILEYKPKPAGGARLEEAHLVVDVGQGMKQRDDLQMAQTVADLLDGQLACSRPIASDRDWFPEWLGLSGAKIKPELCLAVGVSGAIQHIIGIRDSRLIAAVNNDDNAAIFAQADYGVVADLYEFLPIFIDRIKTRGIRPEWKS
jgi:electron transfer flavoprotein alpha subunit